MRVVVPNVYQTATLEVRQFETYGLSGDMGCTRLHLSAGHTNSQEDVRNAITFVNEMSSSRSPVCPGVLAETGGRTDLVRITKRENNKKKRARVDCEVCEEEPNVS